MPKIVNDPKITAGDIAKQLGGKLIGDAAVTISSVAPLDDALPGDITYIRTMSDLALKNHLLKTKASVVLSDRAPVPMVGTAVLIIVANPLAELIKILPLFFEKYGPAIGIHPTADIHPTAKIGHGVNIGAFCSIGALVEIGDKTTIYPHVVIYPGAKIGANSVLHSHSVIREECSVGTNSVIQNGAVIGSDGFGYIPDEKLGLAPVPQIGVVNLSDGVDVGANTCIDRATLGATKIGMGTKIDNQVQIGHNVSIGNYSIVCGQVGIAGSCKIGNKVVLAGQVGVADHLSIPDNTRFAGASVVLSNIKESGDYAGYPAVPALGWHRMIVAAMKLPKLLPKLKGKQKEK